MSSRLLQPNISHKIPDLKLARDKYVHILHRNQHQTITKLFHSYAQQCKKEKAHLTYTSQSLSEELMNNLFEPRSLIEELMNNLFQPNSNSMKNSDMVKCKDLIKNDIKIITQVFEDCLDIPDVKLQAKLGVVDGTTCPKFHQDFVNLRALCTYCGPGTLYIPDEHVHRHPNCVHHSCKFNFDEEFVQSSLPGDILFLKGDGQLGEPGCGAIHRSPDMKDGDLRLLLIINDVQ
eukprot:TRINITY_DN4469_c0_g1_i16.p2 TRINITY_DN4469_c0_g1~~TRINITY_DN4469_c0_g1_i16.p2  ORF type:complete len:233 (-),score=6.86 TRINITY_DN4469_c0_g1_i16:421-1119(-)